MPYQFKKHYTLEEARELLPQVRRWLQQIAEFREQLLEDDKVIGDWLAEGRDAGGTRVNRMVKSLAAIKTVLMEFQSREIQIKDLDRGLLDFPSIKDGREVFLCWEQDEDDIEFWHDLDTGYAGRERL